MQFEFEFKTAGAGERIELDQPLKILLMANFSGHRIGQAPTALAQRRARRVDIDNMDQLLANFAPSLQLDLPDLGQNELSLEFRSLDDFHPDQLFRNLPLFQELRETRAQLQNPASFAQAAEKLRGGLPLPTATPAPAAVSSAGNDFAALLAGNVTRVGAAAKNDFEALIRSIAAPLIVSGHDPSMYLAAVDQTISSLMRAILHHPAFQQLEACWRGVHFVITNLELEESLQLHLLDVSKEELAQDLQQAGSDLSRSKVYPVLVEAGRQAADATAWGVLLGNYHFENTEADVNQLAALAALASQAGAPFLAAAKDSVLGCQSLVEESEPRDWPRLDAQALARWQALRSMPQAAYLGLALPRVLMRLPYGKNSDAIEQFEFEETPLKHEEFLWGNPALACGLLLAQSFQEDAWDMQPGTILDIADMPAYTFRHDGQSHLLPAAETCLLERASEAALQAGLMSLQSFKNRNAVRLLRFQSLALPAKPLSGAWS